MYFWHVGLLKYWRYHTEHLLYSYCTLCIWNIYIFVKIDSNFCHFYFPFTGIALHIRMNNCFLKWCCILTWPAAWILLAAIWVLHWLVFVDIGLSKCTKVKWSFFGNYLDLTSLNIFKIWNAILKLFQFLSHQLTLILRCIRANFVENDFHIYSILRHN